MTLKSSCYKVLSTALIASLLAGTGAYADTLPEQQSADSATTATAATGQATPFTDVAAGHWAEKHIAKLNLQGIIQGKGVGKFGPNDNVTQEDVVVLAIRLMGKSSQVRNDDAVVFPEGFKVSDYAKGYVVLAFQEGLLNRNEELSTLKPESNEEWGKQPASREWVTKLLIRAIGMTELAESLVNVTSSFSDTAQISEGYTGYVNAAVNLKLMNGVSATRFDPQGKITRAMIAKMYSLAEQYYPVSYANQSVGLITALSDTSITLFDTDTASEKTLPISSKALYYRYDAETLAAADKLTKYARAMVIAAESGAVYIEQLDDEVRVETLRGEVSRVVPSENKLWMFINNKPEEIIYPSSVIVKDSNGKTLQITDLATDATIEVVRDTFRAQPMTLEIRVQGGKINKTGQGRIIAVSETGITIADADGTEETWGWASSPLISWNKEIKTVADLAVGDVIAYDIAAGLVTKVNVTSTTVGKTVTGVLQHIDANSKTINYKVDSNSNALNANYLASNVQVSIEGITVSSISDLVKGDQVKLTINDRDEVIQIQVINRKVEMMNGVTILNYDQDSKILTITDSAGKPTAVLLTGSTKVEINGTQSTIDAVRGMLLKNRKVILGFTDGAAVYLNLVNSYTGTLSDISTINSQLTLAFDTGGTMKIPYSSPGVEIYGKTSATFADLKTGDRITALMDNTQEKAISVQVHRTIQQEVVSVDTAAKKIRLKTSDGTINEHSVLSGWKLLNSQGTAVALGSFSPGQVVNVQYVGRQPDTIKQVQTSFGKVTSIGTDQITITALNGAYSDVKLGTGFKVIRNGVTNTSTSALNIGDYVDVRLNETETTVVTVNTGSVKKFRSYVASSKELYVYASTINDASTRYVLDNDTKVIDATGAEITMQSLKNADGLTLYTVNGKLVLIVKS